MAKNFNNKKKSTIQVKFVLTTSGARIMSKSSEYYQDIAYNRTHPQNHVYCIEMVKIGVILANFSVLLVLQSGNYKKSACF